MIITFHLLFSWIIDMARKPDRNDSSQMKNLIQFEDTETSDKRDRNDSSQVKDLMQFWDAKPSDKRDTEGNRKESSSQVGGSSSSSSSSSSHATSSSPSRATSSSPSRAASSSSPSRAASSSSPSRAASSSASHATSSPPSSHRPVGHDKRDKRDEQKDDGSSSCCQLDDLKRLQDCSRQLGRLDYSTHAVLVEVDSISGGGRLRPQSGRDMWNNSFVKMPSSPACSAFVKTGLMKMQNKVCRWDEIQKHLNVLAKKKTADVKDVEEAIIKCNPKYKDQWSFDALSTFVKCIPKTENYYSELFPKIAKLALKLPHYVKKAIPLLQRGRPARITLSQVQISCLLANAFFCTFPHRNATNPNAEYHNYPTINFSSLFGNWSDRKKEKLRAIMHYFNVVTDEKTKLDGLVTFERRRLIGQDISTWRNCEEKMSKLHVALHGAIETEGTGMLQVDFACRLIGGGVLGSGLVQEEILFLINPELIVSRLFTERLDDNECLIITGSQQFSTYSGYGDTFEWAGPHEDLLPRDEWRRKQRQILAIDALYFKHSSEQFSMRKVTRELNKAYCGFKADGNDEPDIATGKWGCGAFHGDPQLKAVIQLMAAARARRGLAYFTFGDEPLKRDLEQIYSLLVKEKTTVGKLFELLEDFCADHKRGGSHVDLFTFIRNHHKPSKSQL